ncbi:TetR family transcriptional regulator [Xylophilus sp. Kf1]|nr:TetR family transcriptional regulator [Xylophilus sp. Kf1]
MNKKTSAASKPKEPELNRASLLAAATREFAGRGFQGARLEVIAQEVAITRAMIYYYFGGREGLYLAALEDVYRHIRASEAAVDLQGLGPVEAVRKLTCFRIDYYVENPLMVAMVNIENQMEAGYIKSSKEIGALAGSSLGPLTSVLRQGQAQGIFRQGVDVVELHQVMVSLGMFNVSHRHTFGAVFERQLDSPQRLVRTRELACEVVLGFLAERAAA